jgi:hypothetical protein
MKLLLNVGRAWPEVEHVYLVGYRNCAIGRLWFAVDRQTDPRAWEWHLSIPMTLPDDSKGIARSRAEALHELGNALHRLILQTPHDRLERAFEFAVAAGLSFERGDEIELTVGEALPPAAPANQPAQALVKSGAAAGPVQRIVQAHASAAAQTPTVTQATLPKKKMPVVRVQVAKPTAQVAAPRPAVATTAARPPATPSPRASGTRTELHKPH